jgi:lipopolysaccharide transport system permease protein
MQEQPSQPRKAVHRIRAGDPGIGFMLGELVASRELLFLLVRRQISIRYAQTVFGAAWVAMQPMLSTLMYALVFGLFVKIDTSPLPYPLFAYAGSVIWSLFAQGLERGGTSLVADERLVTKIYFPRLLLPFSAVLSGLVDLGVAMCILLPWALVTAHTNVVALPLLVLPVITVLLVGTGLSTLISSLNVRWRDLRQVAPFLVQLLVWATPVAYPLAMVPQGWRTAILLNPMTPAVETFRSILLGSAMPPTWSLWTSAATAFALFMLGIMVFRSVEKSFADYI